MDVVVGKVFLEVVAEVKTPGVAQKVALVVDRVADRVAGLDERANEGELMAASIAITAPSSAEEGENVSVMVVVTNISERIYTFKTEIYAVPDLYPDYLIGGGERTLFPGDWKLYEPSFTMPDCNTTVFVRVYRLSAGEWVYDNVASKVVSLEEAPVEVFAGSIARKELEYDEARGNIPVY